MRQVGPALPEPEHHVTGLPCDFCFNVTEFHPSGSHLIALHQSGAGIMWDVDPQLWERRACTVAGRTLTQEEWKELLPARSYRPACR